MPMEGHSFWGLVVDCVVQCDVDSGCWVPSIVAILAKASQGWIRLLGCGLATCYTQESAIVCESCATRPNPYTYTGIHIRTYVCTCVLSCSKYIHVVLHVTYAHCRYPFLYHLS